MAIARLTKNEICVSELFANGIKNLVAAQVLFCKSLKQEVASLNSANYGVF